MKNFLLLSAIAFCAFASCNQEEALPAFSPEVAEPLLAEQAFPGKAGTVEKTYLFNQPIEYSKIGKEAVFQGDILLHPDQLSDTQDPNARFGTGRTSLPSRWPNNVVYYRIDPSLTDQERVYQAMTHWEANTQITFVQRTTQPNYVNFMAGHGCYSYVGMTGGAQDISVGPGCSTGNTIHEIGHALGLWHEQSRADRDAYLLIHEANIQPGLEHNFYTYLQQNQDGFDHGLFDFGSIMMYPPYSFSFNGQPTITKRDGSLYNVQRDALSAGDRAIISAMYSAESTPVVENNIDKIIALFNVGISDGLLVGAGNQKTLEKRLKSFTDGLHKIKALLAAQDEAAACRQLKDILRKIHGNGRLHPTHVITGDGAPAFWAVVNDLRTSLGCK